MNAFDHVLVLLSFVYALALTHLLSRIAGLYFARKRVRYSGLAAILIVIAILMVFFSWLELWPFRNTPSWDLASVIVQFVYAIELYFLCALAAPEIVAEGTIDLDAYYWEEFRPFYGLLAATVLTAMAGNFTFLRTNDLSTFWSWQIGSLPAFPPLILAIAVRARWAQWAAGALAILFIVVLNIILVGIIR